MAKVLAIVVLVEKQEIPLKFLVTLQLQEILLERISNFVEEVDNFRSSLLRLRSWVGISGICLQSTPQRSNVLQPQQSQEGFRRGSTKGASPKL